MITLTILRMLRYILPLDTHLVEIPNDTCVKYFMEPKDYKVFSYHDNEI